MNVFALIIICRTLHVIFDNSQRLHIEISTSHFDSPYLYLLRVFFFWLFLYARNNFTYTNREVVIYRLIFVVKYVYMTSEMRKIKEIVSKSPYST